MQTCHLPPSRRVPARGFTLIELMITVVVIGILAAVLYPNFLSQVRKSRRSDAVQLVAQIQQAQERWRANKSTYGTLADLYGTGTTSVTSAGGYYTVTVSTTPSATGYGLTVTAVSGKSQAGDTGCTSHTVTVSNGEPSYGTPSCWSR